MTADELASAIVSGEAPLIVGALLMLILWAIRNFSRLKEISSKQELVAVGSAAITVVATGLIAGAPWKQTLINGVVVLLVALKWNSPPLPTKAPKEDDNAPPSGPSVLFPRSLLLVVALALPLTGCSRILPVLVEIGTSAQLASDSLGLLATAGDRWADTHPDDTERAAVLRAAIERAQQALRALQLVGSSARAYQYGDAARARSELMAAYRVLWQLAYDLGLVKGSPQQKDPAPKESLPIFSRSAPIPQRQIDPVSPDVLDELLSGEVIDR